MMTLIEYLFAYISYGIEIKQTTGEKACFVANDVKPTSLS